MPNLSLVVNAFNDLVLSIELGTKCFTGIFISIFFTVYENGIVF